MHRLDTGTYIGEPKETATLTTEVDGGGQVSVTVDGRDLGSERRFTLPAAPGDRSTLKIALVGPLGASCVVTIAVVDGTSDADFLICQPHEPAPIHTYTFTAAAKAAVARFALAVGAVAAAKPKAVPRKKAGPSKKGSPSKKGGRR